MKMNKMSFFALTAAALMTGCATDEPAVKDIATDNGERLHAKIQLFLPSTTRSATTDFDGTTNSTDGFEIGQTYENNVNNVTVAIATYDATTGKFTPVAVSATSATPVDGFNPEAPVYSINFRQDDIRNAAGQTVYIFAFCNAEGMLSVDSDFTTDEFVDKIMTISSAAANQGPWANGNFLMANAPNIAIPTKVLPDEESLITKYNTPEKALDLGAVDVARVVSRFDFRQTEDNTYPVYDVNAEEQNADAIIAKVKVLAMAPVNIAKEYFLLPRVSNDGTDANWQLCGVENRNNWVVSPYWNEKNATTLSQTLLDRYFYQNAGKDYSDENMFDYTTLAAFAGADDNDENWGTDLEAEAKTGYKIWRYVTENTIPEIGSQKKGISTGVVFKAEIVEPKAESTLAKAMATGDDIYSFNGTMYGNVAALRKVVATLDVTNTLRKAFVTVFGEENLAVNEAGEFLVADADLVDATADANKSTFKIYRATKGSDGAAHYYVYYLYRNRHNDNGNPNEMGAMEFGTVRNNIYKLSISTISDFGHVGDPDDDDDPEDPEDPDEEPKVYLKVACRVVPWMVRINNIEF